MKYKELRLFLARRFSIPKEELIRKTTRSFTSAEKAVFYFFTALFIFSSLTLLWKVNEAYLVEVPVRGGTLTEGVIGNPRFINPVLAISEADKNLSTLIYSGLVRLDSDGVVQNDLAEEILVSEDALTYTIRLKSGATFHDGEPVTVDDVIFTVQKILDPLIKSPRRATWDGVVVEKISEDTLTFTLKKAYAPFIYNLTIGILPQHIWKNVSEDEFSFSQFNTLPIGSGPYKVDRVGRNSGGIPNYYKLVPAGQNLSGPPFVQNLVFRFYVNEQDLLEAFNEGAVESISGISPEKALELDEVDARVLTSPLPRVFAVFFNQTQAPVLANFEVRRALDISSPKEEIVENILGGFATVIDGPIPAGIYPWSGEREVTKSLDERVAEAQEILAEDGWTPNPDTGILEKKSGTDTITLSFSISTSDVPELRAVGEYLVSTWSRLGADIELVVFEPGDLNQNVIRPRNFDSLLFGEVVGRDADIYPFWHSSQKSDPGLNVAMYDNDEVDKLLDDARSATDKAASESYYKTFSDTVKADIPAVFLYTPSFLYILPQKLESVDIGSLAVSQDRFLSIRDWYIEKDRIWKPFAN